MRVSSEKPELTAQTQEGEERSQPEKFLPGALAGQAVLAPHAQEPSLALGCSRRHNRVRLYFEDQKLLLREAAMVRQPLGLS